MKKFNDLIAKILLILLIISCVLLTYLKFFTSFMPNNKNITENPINESNSKAIHIALKNITVNFNQNNKVKDYEEKNNVNLEASVNNYSIFISYISENTITYEFVYNDLNLSTIIDHQIQQNNEKFNVICGFLIEATQKRINHTDNIDELINNFLYTNINYDGLTKKTLEEGVQYTINITKKLKAN